MTSPGPNFYAAWRERFVRTGVLHDENGLPPERLLQAVWQHQRLCRDQLKTTGGKMVRVFHPGFISVEGGPDFRGAVLQFENEKPVSGDVEVDLQTGGWRAHGHDRNKNFEKVILHVVWDGVGVQASACQNLKIPDQLKRELQRLPPTLSIKDKLDAPLAELSLWLENESASAFPENLRGQCCAPLRELDETQLAELLRQAARVRFQAKAAQFRARARHVGWEQTLWENLFRALGYKHNAWPMQNLAEQRLRLLSGLEFKLQLASAWSRLKAELQQLRRENLLALQARLFGVSGLLPDELTRAQKISDTFLRRAWDFWWRDRDEFENCILPREVWRFNGLRPANHPQRRLALASHWLASENFISKIEDWSATEILDGRAALRHRRADPQVSPIKLVDSLHEIFQVGQDEFWSWHWTFQSARLQKPQPLLGDARVTDLAVNVILPWLWVRAVEGKNEKIQREMERRFFAWPAAEDNSILKLARQRLLGTSSARILKNAAAQQGLMQIVRDFCEHSNAVCEACRFPELVRSWNAQAVT